MLSFFLQILVNLLYVFSFLLIVFSFLRPNLRYRGRREWIAMFLLLLITVLSDFIHNEELNTIMEVLLVFGLLRLYCEGDFLQIVKHYVFGVTFLGVMNAISGMVLGQFFGDSYLDAAAPTVGVLAVSLLTLMILLPICLQMRRSFPKGLKQLTRWELLLFILIAVMDMMIVLWLQSLEDLAGQKMGWRMLLMHVMVCGGICIQLFFLMRTLGLGHIYLEKNQIMERYLEEQKDHYEYLEIRERDTRKFRHDLRSHMGMLRHLAEKGEYAELGSYLKQMSDRIDAAGSLIQTSNGIADAIVNRFDAEAKQRGMTFLVRGQFPAECGLGSMDLCTILSNLLSNALEGVEKCHGRNAALDIRHDEQWIYLMVVNDCDPKLVRSWSSETGGGLFGTTKENPFDHGFGLENVRDCVRANRGWMEILADHGHFTVMIQIKNPKGGQV